MWNSEKWIFDNSHGNRCDTIVLFYNNPFDTKPFTILAFHRFSGDEWDT
jgi:hypothetical protein